MGRLEVILTQRNLTWLCWRHARFGEEVHHIELCERRLEIRAGPREKTNCTQSPWARRFRHTSGFFPFISPWSSFGICPEPLVLEGRPRKPPGPDGAVLPWHVVASSRSLLSSLRRCAATSFGSSKRTGQRRNLEATKLGKATDPCPKPYHAVSRPFEGS